MADVQTKDCNVCKVLHATRYAIHVFEADADGKEVSGPHAPVCWPLVDLCEMHYERLINKIGMLICPPTPRKKKEGDDDGE